MVKRGVVAMLVLAGCGQEHARAGDRCELGQDAYARALADLHAHDLPCTRDDECVRISTDVACNGFSASLCGSIVHRDAASRWDPSAVCDELEGLPESELTCSTQASCAGGEPVCQAGRCTLETLGATASRRLDGGASADAARD